MPVWVDSPPLAYHFEVFSNRTAWDLTPDPLALELRKRQQSGARILDLTASNPTTGGFNYPHEAIANVLADGAVEPYRPEPFGLLSARAAVAAYYRDSHNVLVAPERIVLAAGTSELYSYCFRLLCDPGDEVLLAQPSYPLFDYLAAMDHVQLRHFALIYESGWHLDRRAIEQACTSSTRAVAVIHPNNPTGHYTSAADRQWLMDFCTAKKLALIVDEVFLDFPLETADGQPDRSSCLSLPPSCLTFVMSGLSKVCGLPQMKLAWLCVHGPHELANAALARLEVIADSFLSPSTPIQTAAGALLETRSGFQCRVRERLARNLAACDAALAAHPALSRMKVEGGWSVVVRAPALRPSAEVALELLRETGVHIHPGEFFGFPASGYFVCSLLAPESIFFDGFGALVRYLSCL